MVKELQYLHPYFMSADWYWEHNRRKAEFVYIEEINDGEVSVVIYNETKTEIVDGSAWHSRYELTDGYDHEAWKEIQTQLDELWENYDDETEEEDDQ